MRLMNPASRRLRKAARREAGNKTRDMTVNPEWQNKPLFVTVKQAAGMLGVSHKTVYRLLERRLLKASPMLRHKLITVVSINAFAASANN